MINPTVHLRICLSIHQRDCLFFPPIEHHLSHFTGILLLIEFPRWNFIPNTALFFSLPFSLIVLSRETILQPFPFSPVSQLDSPPSPLRPFSPKSVSLSFFSDNRSTFMYTRRAFEYNAVGQSHDEETRHAVSKMDPVCAAISILLESTSMCMECSRAAGWRIHPNVDCLRLSIVTRNSYRDTKYYTLLLREFMYV